MGIDCETKVFSGPRFVVANEWRSHKAEHRDRFDHGEEGEEEEEEEMDSEESELDDWRRREPSSFVDTRELRPNSRPCRSWDDGRGSCYHGHRCHFRHDTPAKERPAYKEWLARRPEGDLKAGPTGYFRLSMSEPDRSTDQLYDEMVADPIMRAGLGLGVHFPVGGTSIYLDGEFPGGVQRLGYSDSETDCWWRVPDPAVLLGAVSDGSVASDRAELLKLLERELTIARARLTAMRFTHPRTPHAGRVRREGFLEKAKAGIAAALRVLGAARNPSSPPAPASAANHTIRPVVAAVQAAMGGVEDLCERERGLQAHAKFEEKYDSEEEVSDDEDDSNDVYRQLDPKFDSYALIIEESDEEYDHYNRWPTLDLGRRTRREEALRCKEGAYKQRGRGGYSGRYDDDGDFGDGYCNCAEAAIDAAYGALEHVHAIARLLQMPGNLQTYHHGWPAETATDGQLLAAASAKMHENSLRAFLRRAATDGHEVLINHSVG